MTGVFRFDCYPSDFLNGIIGLEGDEIAIYTVVMMLQYDRGGPVVMAGRERELCVRSGLPKRRMEKAVQHLVELGKLVAENGSLSNPRTSKELEKISEKIRINSENSLAGGEATKKKWDGLRNKNNGPTGPTGTPNGHSSASPSQESESPSELKESSSSKDTGAQARDDDDRNKLLKVEEALGPRTPAYVIDGVMPLVRELEDAGCDFEHDILGKFRDIRDSKKQTGKLDTPRPPWLKPQIFIRRDARLNPRAAPKATLVFVEAESPAFRAHVAAGHKPGMNYATGYIENRRTTGWWFSDPWPVVSEGSPPLPRVEIASDNPPVRRHVDMSAVLARSTAVHADLNRANAASGGP